MKEIRIDCAHPTEEEAQMALEQAQLLFRLNHTMPYTPEYDELVHQLIPEMDKSARIVTPLNGVRFNNVNIGKTW